jgi:preprotein translocase subunit YajC
MPTQYDIKPGDIITVLGGKAGLVISIHENEYGLFYNIIVDDSFLVVDSQTVKRG